MSTQPGQVTQIAGQLASRMPHKDVPEAEVAQAIRSTLHYAKDAGLLDEVKRIVDDQTAGDAGVRELLDKLG